MIDQIHKLADTWGPERIHWRFDPIIFWQETGRLRSNAELFKQLVGSIKDVGIKKCIFSFASYYNKILSRIKKFELELVDPELKVKLEALSSMIKIAKKYNIQLASCSQPENYLLPGIEKSSCINGEVLQKLHPNKEPVSTKKDKNQRPGCRCTESIDIGSYAQKCSHACLYCYANPDSRYFK